MVSRKCPPPRILAEGYFARAPDNRSIGNQRGTNVSRLPTLALAGAQLVCYGDPRGSPIQSYVQNYKTKRNKDSNYTDDEKKLVLVASHLFRVKFRRRSALLTFRDRAINSLKNGRL